MSCGLVLGTAPTLIFQAAQRNTSFVSKSEFSVQPQIQKIIIIKTQHFLQLAVVAILTWNRSGFCGRGVLVKAGCLWGCLLPLPCANTRARTRPLHLVSIPVWRCQPLLKKTPGLGIRRMPLHRTQCSSGNVYSDTAIARFILVTFFTALDRMAGRG